MDLRSVILGLLSWKPSSGYDLKRIISDSNVFYWSGNNNQIYKSLLELQNEGLVTHQVQTQEHLPAKKVYSITEEGLAELRRSLLTVPELPEVHKDFIIQLAWAEILPDEEILAMLEKYESEVAGRLLLYQAQAARAGDRPDRSERERYFWKRIAGNVIASYQVELDWVRQTLREFREKQFTD